jgi:hypothetical protein
MMRVESSTKSSSSTTCPARGSRRLHRATEELRAIGARESALKVGALVPALEFSNQDGELVRSADLLARGPLVMELQGRPAVRASYERVPRSSPSLRRGVSMGGPCSGARRVARGEGARLVDVDGRS